MVYLENYRSVGINSRVYFPLFFQILIDRYFIRVNNKIVESPQAFWMRVAMGLALNEDNKEDRAIEFYNLFSNFLYTPSTPT